MSKITQIKSQRDKNRANIFLDGRFAFGLDLDNLVKAGLKIGQDLSEQEIEDLIVKNQLQRFYDQALRLIAIRPRSEKEIFNYLKKKIWKMSLQKSSENQSFGDWQFHESKTLIKEKIVREVIEKLKEHKLIDDEAFVAWWLEQRSTFRPRGKQALMVELKRKGIDRQTIESMLNREVDELALARQTAQKKAKSLKTFTDQEFRRKMTAYLARRGFSWETIRQVLEELA